MSTVPITDEEIFAHHPYRPFGVPNRLTSKPIFLNQRENTSSTTLFRLPFLAPLLFHNEQSDVRDHCANERTFLSWLRLATYLAIVGVALVISFHLKSKPTDLERRASLPLGLLFWALSLGCLVSGAGRYCLTVERYGRRTALVQSGWRTQALFTVVATAIVATCVFLLSVEAKE
ncbi:MAG: hypothetical protein M1828_004588 [Chrysothrix sp. TS-e1954]|nr:MAG: hypothetical protein M1828_004588 [Chrysothrix sp. TS-e1954]